MSGMWGAGEWPDDTPVRRDRASVHMTPRVKPGGYGLLRPQPSLGQALRSSRSQRLPTAADAAREIRTEDGGHFAGAEYAVYPSRLTENVDAQNAAADQRQAQGM
jgi:hypothetical protein